MVKPDIRANTLLSWDEYTDKPATTALTSIYDHAVRSTKTRRDWYWTSIKNKKRSSLGILFTTLILLILGTVLPLLAGLVDKPEVRLEYTQVGVVALACAGLLQVSDRVFGWSSGWLRYIATVTAMENLTQRFELDWAGYVIEKRNIGDLDIKPLFTLAKQFEDDILKLQTDETAKWVTEFGSSVALLGELIKSQRESADKAAETARAAFEAQQKNTQKGSVEVKLVHKAAPIALDISIDNDTPESFTGLVWAKSNLLPGQHVIAVGPHGAAGPIVRKILTVSAGSVTQTEVSFA